MSRVHHLIAELQRAKRASEAPWLRKIGNPSSQENLVMTSSYDRASERANARTDSGVGEGASRDIPHGHPYGKLFPWRFFVQKSQKNTHFCLPCQQTIGEVDLTFQGRV